MVAACCAIIALVGLERLAELYLSARNAAWSRARGGLEFGLDHLGLMKLLHTGLLVGCIAETVVTGGAQPGMSMALWGALALLAQALRYWCIASLGRRWNIRVIVIPNLPPVTKGPYRYLPHPNYVAVVLEGVALPMVFGAWRTALVFSLLNALLLRRRIACESRAITEVCGPSIAPQPQSERAA